MPRKRRQKRTRTRTTRDNLEARERAFEVLHLMRSKGRSLTAAAREARTTIQTARKYVPAALQQSPGGRYAATPSDRYTRRVWHLTPKGKEEVAIRGSRAAERVAAYMAAVDWYLRTGDTSRLAEFRGEGIRSGKKLFPFLTNSAALDRLAQAGEVSFERLYTRRA